MNRDDKDYGFTPEFLWFLVVMMVAMVVVILVTVIL